MSNRCALQPPPSEPVYAQELRYMGRLVYQMMEFNADPANPISASGSFDSMYRAEHWLHDSGYSTGSSCEPFPTAIMRGDYYQYGLPEKWKNFTQEQKEKVHGVMTGDFRNGPVIVCIFQ